MKYNIEIDEKRKEELLALLSTNGFDDINLKEEPNMSTMVDLYELTMSQVNFDNNEENLIEYYDGFFRKEPLDAGYGVVCGVNTMIDYIKNLHFTDSDIAYLKSTNKFSDEFLEYLRNFKFKGDIWAVEDGTPIFRNEPFITVRGNAIETKIVETAILSIYNSQIAYATAARKIYEATNSYDSDKISLMEFGARRAYGMEAAVDASICSYIVGFDGTSNVLAGKKYNIPVMGTMAHSAVMEANSEYEAFVKYAKSYPDKPLFLVDTYDTLYSGVENAIKVCKDLGIELGGIRIDSGDLAYLSKEALNIMKKEFPNAKICLSNGLNDKSINSLKHQGAIFHSLGVGDNVASPDKRVGAVYKNCAVENNDEIIPKIKISGDKIKTTNPGFKKVYRFYDKETGYALGDVIADNKEIISTTRYTLVNHEDPLQTKELTTYDVRCLQVPIFINGKLVYDEPTIEEKRIYCNSEMNKLYPEVRRIEKPHKYIVDLSDYERCLKDDMIKEEHEKIKKLVKRY